MTVRDCDADAAAVRGLYEQLVEGWNTGSGATFAAAFTEDGDLIAFDGTVLHGRHEIESFQQELFDKWVKGTRLTGTVCDVRFLDDDTAVMHARGGTTGRRRSKPARARDSIQTLVATRTPQGWRLAAFQNTRVRPIGAGFATFVHWSIGDALWSALRLSTDPARERQAILVSGGCGARRLLRPHDMTKGATWTRSTKWRDGSSENSPTRMLRRCPGGTSSRCSSAPRCSG